MSRRFTVQCGYFAHYANTVTVEAGTLDEALEKAVAAANEDGDGWRSTDHCSDTYVDAVCEGAGGDPWGEGSLPVPDRFSERGEPPVVTLSGPVPPGAVEVSGGRALVRIVRAAGTVTTELRDPPHPPASELGTVVPVGPRKPGRTPLVTVSVDQDGRPDVRVEGGRARVRILDRRSGPGGPGLPSPVPARAPRRGGRFAPG